MSEGVARVERMVDFFWVKRGEMGGRFGNGVGGMVFGIGAGDMQILRSLYDSEKDLYFLIGEGAFK